MVVGGGDPLNEPLIVCQNLDKQSLYLLFTSNVSDELIDAVNHLFFWLQEYLWKFSTQNHIEKIQEVIENLLGNLILHVVDIFGDAHKKLNQTLNKPTNATLLFIRDFAHHFLGLRML